MNRLPFLAMTLAVGAVASFSGCTNRSAQTQQSPIERTASASIPQMGKIQPVAEFHGPMPTGVAVSRSGRIFVNYPRWEDPVQFTVAEVKDGKEVAFPSAEMNKFQLGNQSDHLVAVQSVVVDPKDRLWILDTAAINMGPVLEGGPKLVGIDLGTNQVFKRINFPQDVALRTTYLNDVRFDLNRGKEGMAFITDSSAEGSNGIIVVDLGSGDSWRRLNDHPSTKADSNFVPMVEGQPLMKREPGKPAEPIKMGADGIAIDPKKGLLYYCPLGSRRLYSVSLDALADRSATDEKIASTIRELPSRDFASDGLECASDGMLYLTDYEHNQIRRLTNDGKYEVIASDPRMIWPDSMSISGSSLYFTANQLNRQATYQGGQDLRKKPYVVFKTATGSRSAN